MEDVNKIPMTDKTDNSCILQFSEIVPHVRADDDFPYTAVDVKWEELQDAEVGSADENDIKDPNGSDFCNRPDFICSVGEVKQENSQEEKEEDAYEDDIEDPNYSECYFRSECICPVAESEQEDLQDVNADEAADENDVEDPINSVKPEVSYVHTESSDICFPVDATGSYVRPDVVLEKLDLTRVKNKCNVYVNPGVCHAMSETDEVAIHGLSDNRSRLLQTSDRSTQHVNLSDHLRHDARNQLHNAEDCKHSSMASDTAADYDAAASDENSQWSLTGEVDSEKFEQLWDSKKHTRSEAGKRPFECEVCSNSFLWQSSLTVHMRTHTGERPFCCMLCNSKFSRSFDLKQHLRTHTGEQPFCCEICNSSFARRSSLKQHLLIHTGDRRFSCKVCKCNFLQASALKAHMLTHSDKQPAEDEHLRDDASNQLDDAEDCIQSSTDPDTAADYDAVAIDENSQRPITCEVGGEKFQQLRDFKKHTGGEAGEETFECEVCSKSFLWRSLLKRHMRIHTGERPFSCKVCKRNFTQSSTLTDHMRVHTGERPFRCKICKSSFAHGSNLKRHMHIHNREHQQ